MDEKNANQAVEKTGFFAKIKQKFFKEPQNRKDLVEVLKESADNALIDRATFDMIEGVIEMADLRVRDIMIARGQISVINKTMTLDECVRIIIDSGHSRFPVISDDKKDGVAGIVHSKDLLRFLGAKAKDFDIESILRPAVIVPESKRVDRMLKEFRSERFHMALVVDEFGAISGLVTIEDILEQIVGDIEDEFSEKSEEQIRRLSQHSFSVSALTTIEDFNEYFATSFDDEEVDTVGGLVIQACEKLPQKGEIINLSGIEFKITSSDSRRICTLRVTLTDEQLTQAPCTIAS